MFVRVRRYDREGWRGCFQRVEYRSGIPVAIYSRSHAKAQAAHYTVIESVRTEIGPRQKVIASWLDNPSLSGAINAEHDAAERTARRAIDHARSAGEKLLMAKAQVGHGQWLSWVSANCPALSARTARAYMQLSRNWGMLETKMADSANLSIDAALKLLNAPDSDIDPLESWLSTLLTDSRFPIGTIGWMRDIPPAVVFLDAIGWTAAAIAERLSIPEKTVRALLDPQQFERPDLLRHELNPGLDYISSVVDRAQREYHWHVAAELADRRGFFCRGVSAIARKFSRNDLAERFTGMEQVYFREGERAHSKIPEWPDTAEINAKIAATDDDSDLLIMGAFIAGMCDAARAFTGEPPEYPELPVARFIARLWRDYWEQDQAWKQAIADGATPIEAATQLEPA